MQRIVTKPWFAIIGLLIVATIDKFVFGLFPRETRFYLHDITEWFYLIFAVLLIYSISWSIVRAIKARRSTGNEAAELERQREIEKKEIDMVRKSNEILLHLIQDEHRKGDR